MRIAVGKASKVLALFTACGLVLQTFAQQGMPMVERPRAPILWRPYQAASVPPIQLKNSSRLYGLMRAGKLYLTVQDAIALAIENNLDLEVDRYGPVVAQWNLERLRGGGALPGVTPSNNLVNQVTSGQGVAGSQLSAGLLNLNQGNGNGTNNALVSQVGPITPNLDPFLLNTTIFAHTTVPQANTVQSQTEALVGATHRFNTFVQEGVLSGGFVQITQNESYLKENAPTDYLNPSVAPVAQIFVRHNFLQGFGTGVNSRFIRVAEKQIGASREAFRSELLNIIANVLNLYWDLVTFNDDLRVRRSALEAAQKSLTDTQNQIGLGVVARVELFRAQAEVSTRRQEQDIAQATVRQQETLLKDMLSRNGLEDPVLDAAEIVPLDHIEVPQQDELPGLRELLSRALAKRPDVELAKIADETAQISVSGTANGILPFLQGTASTTGHGLAGAAIPQSNGTTADPYYVGGLGNALGQIFRRNFYDRRGQLVFQGRIGNHIAQADYGIDQLQLRQGDLIERRNMNDIVVAISNQMTALRQARARYSQAADTRTLQGELLEKEQQLFSFGSATINDVVASRRALIDAQLAEVSALASYMRARVGLDQTLGETLEANHVSVDEALSGRVTRESKLPDAP